MPTNFERAKYIIRKLVPIARRNIHDEDLGVDGYVKRRLNQLSQAYGDRLLRENREPIEYQMATTQIAYAYRTLAAHGDWLYKAMRSARLACRRAIDRDPVKIVALGGGPGSDIMGVLKFAIEADLVERDFELVVLDNEPAWERVRRFLLETYDGFNITHRSEPFDATADGIWTDNWDFANANIFTLSFFLSEVWSFNGEGSVSRFLQELIDRARPGALFVYVDNGGDEFAPLAEAEFVRDDIELISMDDDNRLLMSFDEQCDVLAEFRERFGQMPKLRGNVSWRVWRKANG